MECPSCRGRVKFQSEQTGQEVGCPHCGEILILQPTIPVPRPIPVKTLDKQLAPTIKPETPAKSRPKLQWMLCLAACLVLGSVIVLGFIRVRDRNLEIARDIDERTFPLVDAYKFPPFAVDGGPSRLIGKTVQRDYGGLTAQFVDRVREAKEAMEAENKRISEWWVKKYENTYRGAASYFLRLPGDSATDNLNKQILAEETATRRFEELRPEAEGMVSNAYWARQKLLDRWFAESNIVDVEAGTRIRVLNISAHYAKVVLLNGANSNRTVFVQIGNILLR